MKIGVITGYYSENSGTILQAYAIGQKLREMGNDVVYINTKNQYSTHSFKKLFGRIIKETIKGRFSNASAAIKKYGYFKKSIRMFDVIPLEKAIEAHIDCFVIGSDTVWNLNSIYFREAHHQYFPEIPEIKTISYAAAVGNTDECTFIKYPYVKNSLSLMEHIAVRDAFSKKVISQFTDKEIEVVCDPTILLGINGFERFKYNVEQPPYLLAYVFEDLEKCLSDKIVNYAKANNLKIISIGKKYSWCNEQIVNSVENFISYYSSASFIVTNTFHGNVFSILNNKQFVCAPCQKKKVIELLKGVNLESRIISDYDDFDRLVNEKIDYNLVNPIIDSIRKQSENYLINSLQ